MIFMVAFIVLCVLAVKNTRTIRKLKRRLDSFEVTLRLRDHDNVTQQLVADPAQLGQDCVTNENVKG